MGGAPVEGAGRNDRIVRFGLYEIDRQARELRRSGQRVPLQIQPFAVLDVLVERAGQVVTREELRARIWPSTVYVDFNHGLNNAVARLRQALEDSADSPRYLETLPRVGYRFIHPLQLDEPVHPAASPTRPGGAVIPRAGLTLPAVLVVGVLAIGVAGWLKAGTLTRQEAVVVGPLSTSAEARDAYLRGLEFLEQRRKESIQLGIEYLSRATEIDPGFAAAHAALAMAYTAAGGKTLTQYRRASDVLAPALAAAHRALQLDPGLAQAHVALAGVLNHLQPWSAANDVVVEHSYRRALELDPENADAHLFYGNFLATRGRSDEAVQQFRLALESNPLSPSINSRLGMELVALGRTEQGLEYLRKTVELDPWQFNAHVRLGWGYVALGDLDAAEGAFGVAERISPNSLQSQGGLAYIAARRGDVEAARTLLRTVQSLADAVDDPFEVAIVHVALEDRDNAIEWLARTARQTRTLHMAGPWGIHSPVYDWLRDDPRFAQIERDIAATTSAGPPIQPKADARSGAPKIVSLDAIEATAPPYQR